MRKAALLDVVLQPRHRKVRTKKEDRKTADKVEGDKEEFKTKSERGCSNIVKTTGCMRREVLQPVSVRDQATQSNMY
jgi:hypothetical protein